MKQKTFKLILAATFAWSSVSFGRDQAMPEIYQATSSTSTTTTYPKETIQDLAKQAEGNTNKGKGFAKAGMAITAIGVVATCFTAPPKPSCKMFVAGLAATTLMSMFMGKASGTSAQTAAKVTTTEDPNVPPTVEKPTSTPITAPDYTQDPDYQNAIKTIKKLTDNGWKIDTNKGAITDPKGNKFTTAVLNSSDAQKAAGISASDMKAFDSAMAKLPALAAEKAKSADAGSNGYEDAAGGGGAKPASSADSGLGAYGGLPTGQTGPSLGIDRDPAQVAGMKKDFNGNPIGVAADSLFQMVDRRYELHQKNGSFLPQ